VQPKTGAAVLIVMEEHPIGRTEEEEEQIPTYRRKLELKHKQK